MAALTDPDDLETIELPIGAHRLVLQQVRGLAERVRRAVLTGEAAPHWAVLWPSARVLANQVSLAGDLRGRRVLELGCGLGAPSLVAAALGAEVLATDVAPEALELVARNAVANGLQVRTRLVDFFAPPADLGVFDGIVAADVAYGDGMLGAVLRIVRRCLAPDGLAVLADPNRVMEGGVEGAARLHGLHATSLVLQPGPSVVGGVSLHQLARRR